MFNVFFNYFSVLFFISEKAADDGVGAGAHDGAESVPRGAGGNGLGAGRLAAGHGIDDIGAERAHNGGRSV